MWHAQAKLLNLALVLGGPLSLMSLIAEGLEANLREDTTGAGVYDLVTAAGRDLPAVVSETSTTGYKQEVIGGSVTLRENRTFQWTTVYRYTEGGNVTISESSGAGTYKLEGDDITLSEQPGSTTLTGKLKGRSLFLKADVELVYKRK